MADELTFSATGKPSRAAAEAASSALDTSIHGATRMPAPSMTRCASASVSWQRFSARAPSKAAEMAGRLKSENAGVSPIGRSSQRRYRISAESACEASSGNV